MYKVQLLFLSTETVLFRTGANPSAMNITFEWRHVSEMRER